MPCTIVNTRSTASYVPAAVKENEHLVAIPSKALSSCKSFTPTHTNIILHRYVIVLLLKGTIRRVCVILNHRPVKSKHFDHVVVSDLICHCVDHAHYPSTVPHVIVSAADLLTLVQPRRTRRTAQRVS